MRLFVWVRECLCWRVSEDPSECVCGGVCVGEYVCVRVAARLCVCVGACLWVRMHGFVCACVCSCV